MTKEDVVITEQLSPREIAFNLTKQVLSDPARLEAVKAGVGRYTNNVDVEFRGLESVLASKNTQIFSENRGVAYMLWGAFDNMARQGQEVDLESLSNEDLAEIVYQAYSIAGASGV